MYKTKIAVPIASLLLLMLLTSTFNFGTSYSQFAGSEAPSNTTQGALQSNNTTGIATPVRQGQFDAAQIYRTNNMTVINPSIRNLAIIIPDNIGSNKSAPSWPTFLPANATIAEGMQVIWFNADVNATHNIVVKNSTGATLNSTSIPYQNASVYRFGQAGQYTFSDPSLPRKNGTINVVEPTSFNASSFTNASGTVGLFVIPAAGKPNFDLHINRLGFNGVSAFNFTTFQGTANNNGARSTNDNLASTPEVNGTSNAKILYVWSQETSGIHTTITRIANKARIIENINYPHSLVKMP